MNYIVTYRYGSDNTQYKLVIDANTAEEARRKAIIDIPAIMPIHILCVSEATEVNGVYYESYSNRVYY